jgi:Ni/Co efflux regulator RcnB
MSNTMRKTLSLIGVVGMLAAVSAQSFAATEFQKEHPRRAEVNHRLENQDKRIHQEVKEGKMSKAEAKKLHKEDHQIRKEEKSMASQNGGHITKLEQKTLNQQENSVSKQIGK